MKIIGSAAVLVICVLQIASADWNELKETQKSMVAEVVKELTRFKDFKDNLTIDIYWDMNQIITKSLDDTLRSIPINKIGHPGPQGKEIGNRECMEVLNKHIAASRALVVDAIEPCITDFHNAVVPILKNLDTLIHIAEGLLRELEEADLYCKSDSEKEICLQEKLHDLKFDLLLLRTRAILAQETTGMSDTIYVDRAMECLKEPLSKSKKKISDVAGMDEACAP